MEFNIYCVYDPELEAFDGRLNLAPFGPEEMAEQYRRTAIKLNPAQKAEAAGKEVIWMGSFDDVTGKISQGKMLKIFVFEKDKDEDKEESQVKEEKEEGQPNA